MDASRSTLSEIEAHVDRDVFYDVYRPLLGGFYPEGILLEGVEPQGWDSEAEEAPAQKMPWVQEGGVGGLLVSPKGPSAGQVLCTDIKRLQ